MATCESWNNLTTKYSGQNYAPTKLNSRFFALLPPRNNRNLIGISRPEFRGRTGPKPNHNSVHIYFSKWPDTLHRFRIWGRHVSPGRDPKLVKSLNLWEFRRDSIELNQKSPQIRPQILTLETQRRTRTTTMVRRRDPLVNIDCLIVVVVLFFSPIRQNFFAVVKVMYLTRHKISDNGKSKCLHNLQPYAAS